jgi:hypothetical protein
MTTDFETLIDSNPVRFGTLRWWLIRKLLAALNLAEGRFAKVREWALQEAVECSPDFDTFQDWVVEHYAARGRKVTFDVIEAVVPPVVPPLTHVNPSTWVH